MTNAETIEELLAARVADRELAGVATLLYRGGLTRVTCSGVRDLGNQLPVERNTIFRIASMSKPVTTALALMLYEEGRFRLNDSIATVAPEFEHMRVLRSAECPLEETYGADRSITFDDLLTHRAGFTQAGLYRGPIGEAYVEVLGPNIDNAMDPDEWIGRLALLPLIDQPGAGFHYGHSTDLLGFLIARIEGAPLGEVLQRRIFGPLGMHDTGFFIPFEKRIRCAGPCGFDDAGNLIALQRLPGGHTLPERPLGMAFASGGQGLWSTLDDYLAFARMFVGNGTVDGVRILKPQTLSMMASNQLNATQRASAGMFGSRLLRKAMVMALEWL